MRLFNLSSIWIHIECVLDEFPMNTWHVSWTPGENFPLLMAELNEHAFLCGVEVGRNGGCLIWVTWVNSHLFHVPSRVKSLVYQGSMIRGGFRTTPHHVHQQHPHSSPTSSRHGREGRRRTTRKKHRSSIRRRRQQLK
jgi:hypothetical protein